MGVADTAATAQREVEIKEGGGTGRILPQAERTCSCQSWRGRLPVEQFTVRFWRAISIWRMTSACFQVVARAWERRVTSRRWKVPKPRSILPLA